MLLYICMYSYVENNHTAYAGVCTSPRLRKQTGNFLGLTQNYFPEVIQTL